MKAIQRFIANFISALALFIGILAVMDGLWFSYDCGRDYYGCSADNASTQLVSVVTGGILIIMVYLGQIASTLSKQHSKSIDIEARIVENTTQVENLIALTRMVGKAEYNQLQNLEKAISSKNPSFD